LSGSRDGSRRGCSFVVRVSAKKEIEIAIANSGEIVANHVPDYAGFLPAWNKNRYPAFFFEKLAQRRVYCGPPVRKPVSQANSQWDKIIDPAQQEKNRE